MRGFYRSPLVSSHKGTIIRKPFQWHEIIIVGSPVCQSLNLSIHPITKCLLVVCASICPSVRCFRTLSWEWLHTWHGVAFWTLSKLIIFCRACVIIRWHFVILQASEFTCTSNTEVIWTTRKRYGISVFSRMSNIIRCNRCNELTHCGLVTPYGGRDLGQHWFR